MKDEEALWIFDTKDVESVSDFWHKNANASDLRKDGEKRWKFSYKRCCKRWNFFNQKCTDCEVILIRIQQPCDSLENLINATTV